MLESNPPLPRVRIASMVNHGDDSNQVIFLSIENAVWELGNTSAANILINILKRVWIRRDSVDSR